MSARRTLRLALIACLAATAAASTRTRRPEIVLVSRAKERELGEQEAR